MNNALRRTLYARRRVSRYHKKTKNSHRFAVVAEQICLLHCQPALVLSFCRSPLHPPCIAAETSILKLILHRARVSAPTLLITVDTFQEHSAETKRAVPK